MVLYYLNLPIAFYTHQGHGLKFADGVTCPSRTRWFPLHHEMPRSQRAGVLVRSWRGPWRAAGLTLLSSCAAGGVPGLNRSAWSAGPDNVQMLQQRNRGQLPPPHKAAVADPLTACLDANGTYICTAYNPRCYIIQKVRLGVEDKLPYVIRRLLFVVGSAQCQCLASLCGLLAATCEVHLPFFSGVRWWYT